MGAAAPKPPPAMNTKEGAQANTDPKNKDIPYAKNTKTSSKYVALVQVPAWSSAKA